ncbi:MAG TPA: DNA polymerase/3'-5' exonuclease PolX [Candidatus Nanoarchaeia archaeon]|nr:DNA polymerase/3'-5' exonuclease PolX [Candidatus Nanoarchaeia archaeon]
MQNGEIAAIFYQIADLLELQDVPFKPQAYRKAARQLESMSDDIEQVAKEGKLEEIPGVGKALAEKIQEYIRTGKIKHLEELKKKVPGNLDELLAVPGLGPKRAVILYRKLKVDSLEDLEKAASLGKIRNIEGFGEKSEQEILKGISLLRRGQERMLLGVALPIAREIAKKLQELDEVQKIEIGGSIRRRAETIGDIDLLITSTKPQKVMDFFTSMPEVERTLAKGDTKSSVLLGNGKQVDLRIVENKSFGAALQYFTGNKDHNVKLRTIAIKKGLKLSEYGLFRKNKLVAGKTEQEVYAALGMKYIEPEMRENQGEIELAIKGNLSKLIGYGDMKGDFQMHTKFSDGVNTIKEMAIAAKQLGYEYIAITDHSKSERIANGMDEKRLLQYVQEIRKAEKEVKGIRIFVSCEVSIKVDGSLDYSDDILKKLDIVSVSIHSGFKMPKETMTQRICSALQNKYVDIFNHPTGRYINLRDPYDFDFDKMVETSVKNKVHLEINASPERLDLKDSLIRRAKELGAKFTVSTDAHSINGLVAMELGVAMARRGWLEKKDVVNAHGLKELSKFFKHKNL